MEREKRELCMMHSKSYISRWSGPTLRNLATLMILVPQGSSRKKILSRDIRDNIAGSSHGNVKTKMPLMVKVSEKRRELHEDAEATKHVKKHDACK